MRRRGPAFAVALVALALIAVGAVTATNTVSSSWADDTAQGGPTANDMKPPECASLDLSVISGGGGGGGGGQSALILGTPGNDRLNGAAGDDCLVGGAGDDNLKGNAGYDVCLGGPGNDTFHQSCEVQIQ
jgi:Ca2+-binding RTX toxin-like protein